MPTPSSLTTPLPILLSVQVTYLSTSRLLGLIEWTSCSEKTNIRIHYCPSQGPSWEWNSAALFRKLAPNVSDRISASNVIVNDAAGTSDFKLGDKVFGLAYGGAVRSPFIEE